MGARSWPFPLRVAMLTMHLPLQPACSAPTPSRWSTCYSCCCCPGSRALPITASEVRARQWLLPGRGGLGAQSSLFTCSRLGHEGGVRWVLLRPWAVKNFLCGLTATGKG